MELARRQPLRARAGLRALATAARRRAGGAAARRAGPHREPADVHASDGAPRNLQRQRLGAAPHAERATASGERVPEALRDLTALKRSHPMMDAVIEEIDGRMIRVGSQWLADFASCNYLGFDLDREIIDAVPAYLDAWGTHPSWSRLLGSPVLYEQIEERLTALLGSPDSLVLPTITHIHMSVIPVLAASGTIFLDSRSHKTIFDGCQMAQARGASVKRFRFEDARAPGRAAAGRAGGAQRWCAWTGSTA